MIDVDLNLIRSNISKRDNIRSSYDGLVQSGEGGRTRNTEKVGESYIKLQFRLGQRDTKVCHHYMIRFVLFLIPKSELDAYSSSLQFQTCVLRIFSPNEIVLGHGVQGFVNLFHFSLATFEMAAP